MFKVDKEAELVTSNKDYMDVEYPIVEHFYTIQGEGAHTGRARRRASQNVGPAIS